MSTLIGPNFIQAKTKHFIVDDANKVIYCAISKAGNTNWKKVMAVLGGGINNQARWHFDDVDKVPGDPGTPIHESWFFKRLSTFSMDEIKEKLNDRYYHKFTFGTELYISMLSMTHFSMTHFFKLSESQRSIVSNIISIFGQIQYG